MPWWGRAHWARGSFCASHRLKTVTFGPVGVAWGGFGEDGGFSSLGLGAAYAILSTEDISSLPYSTSAGDRLTLSDDDSVPVQLTSGAPPIPPGACFLSSSEGEAHRVLRRVLSGQGVPWRNS